MIEGKCTKTFPKEFQEKPKLNLNGYPLYRRREGQTVESRRVVIDNRYVVPYNPYLL